MSGATEFQLQAPLLKYDEEIGVALGWAVVCKERDASGAWVRHYDSQGDAVSESGLTAAAASFCAGAERPSKVMHEGESVGAVLWAFPLTSDVQKALSIQCDKAGLLVGIKPSSPAVLEQVRSGALGMFSIGGAYGESEVVET